MPTNQFDSRAKGEHQPLCESVKENFVKEMVSCQRSCRGAYTIKLEYFDLSRKHLTVHIGSLYIICLLNNFSATAAH